MKRKPTPENSDWNLSFWVVALWPLIVVAIVAIGFLAPALIKTL
jgi:nitrate reductase NapE component